MNDEDMAALAITLIMLTLGFALIFGGLHSFQTANFANPVEGAQQSTTGLISTGIGITLVLVAVGATAVLGLILHFIEKAAGLD